MSRRFLASGSAKVTSASLVLCASPCYVTGFALASTDATAACAAIFDSASNTIPGTQIWALAASSGQSPQAQFAPLLCRNGLVLAASGGSAMAAWER